MDANRYVIAGISGLIQYQIDQLPAEALHFRGIVAGDFDTQCIVETIIDSANVFEARI